MMDILERQGASLVQDENDGGSKLEGSICVSNLQIRINEGHNLDNAKLRQVAGDRIPRKPVAASSKLHNGRDALDDPFSTPMKPVIATERPSFVFGLINDVASSKSSPNSCGFWELEAGFDDDLEDGVLSILPLGSSTPRIRVQRASIASVDISPVKQPFHPAGYRSGNNSSCSGAQQVSTSAKAQVPGGGKEKRVGGQDWPVTRSISKPGTSNARLPGCKRVKKHPSPSKGELENLEIAFERYASLKGAGARDEELDELARDFEPPLPRCLAPGDSNRRMSVRSSATESSIASGWMDTSTPRSPRVDCQSSRIPRPTDQGFKLRSEPRVAVAYRPAAACSDEVDELL
ncbi:hypothetical protein S40288_06544 [Stachybotrys chartarum IBT 40288]|nr:hypothetical protein S40288_06544 [Stachybotrys chartarum IBT 40288]